MQTRLQELYETTVKPALMKEFGYTNAMQVPKLADRCVSMATQAQHLLCKIMQHASCYRQRSIL